MNLKNLSLRSLFLHPRLADWLAFLGGCVYFAQSFVYVFALVSETDEAAYLYQGYLFAKGVYQPFQDYGPYMYNGPISYLVLGYIQTWFGPGLRTGRYFAIFLGLLMLLGVWIAARRLGGSWWAVAVVWAIALNPAAIKIYSLAETQVLIACMLAWVLVLVLGKDRPLWQVVASSVLAGLIVLTRNNLAPVLPILLIYIFWQHGKKAGFWALLFGLLTVVIGHVIYWPNILVIWALWLPAKLTPFLDPFRRPLWGFLTQTPASFSARLLAFTQGIRFNYAAMVGSLAALLLWPKAGQWKNRTNMRASLFLASLFFILLVLHGWASLFNNFCIFCFTSYSAFFSIVAILLIISSFDSWVKHVSGARRLIIAAVVLLLPACIGYAAYEDYGDWLLNIRIPRLKAIIMTGKIQQGYKLWDVLMNKFHLEYAELRIITPTIIGVIVSLIFLFVAWAIWRKNLRKKRLDLMVFLLIVLLVSGIALSPTLLLGGGYRQYDCQANTIASYEQIGHYLAEIISPGNRVYWDGYSAIPLLYVPGIRILPGQIYGFWSFSPDKDTDKVLKYGLWNDVASDQWRNEADFILIEAKSYNSQWNDFFSSNPQFEELEPYPNPIPCLDETSLRIFHRKP